MKAVYPRTDGSLTFRRSIRKWQQFGDSLAEHVGETLLTWIAQNARRVIAYSDLPLEWCMVDGIPLGYLKPVSRIPLERRIV
jgi:hypothetical protein